MLLYSYLMREARCASCSRHQLPSRQPAGCGTASSMHTASWLHLQTMAAVFAAAAVGEAALRHAACELCVGKCCVHVHTDIAEAFVDLFAQRSE